MSDATREPHGDKPTLRKQALARRRDLPEKDALSHLVWKKVVALEEYRRARAVMSYLGVRSEVRTRPFLPQVLEDGKILVVPYCVEERLGLFRLESLEELATGYFGLLEPLPELRGRQDKQCQAAQLDLVLVPGVAFDPQGGRLGHGKGYYDRLLSQVRQDAFLVGLAFECQIVPAVPTHPHDVAMDLVITESSIYRGRGRRWLV
jgi:5-formyltetrahydrofolate cyclo-ligase